MTTTVERPTSSRATTIALKLLMAVTGLIFVGYVLLHMYGNLKAFGGQAAFDEYAHHLRTMLMPILPYGGLVWILRVVLILALVGHAFSAFALWKRAGAARGQKYQVKKAVKATIASRTMRWGGVALLAFVVFHILHFTTRTISPGGDFDSPYERVVNSFELWWVTAIYLLALVALAMHLRHGVFSAMQTLGFTGTATRRRWANTAAVALAVIVAGGFALVPIAALAGLIS